MLKVLLADDEPFILQGLEVLIDWEAEGFTIVKLAQNGQEALDYLRDNPVDLIFADIKMPVMDGIELLQTIRNEKISDALFVILSGYNDFVYARTALRYNCMDYILKPVQKEELRKILRQAAVRRAERISEQAWRQEMRREQMERQIVSLLQGRGEEEAVEKLRAHLGSDGPFRYVHIGMDVVSMQDEFSDGELAEQKDTMLKSCRKFLGALENCCFPDLFGYEREQEIALIYRKDQMAPAREQEEEFFRSLHKEIQKQMELPVYLLVGKAVDSLAQLGHSYSTACMLRSFIGFHEGKCIYYYEREIHSERGTVVLCKNSLDRLLEAVKMNHRADMTRCLDLLYSELEQSGMDYHIANMNINYLLFQLIHLAVDQDDSVNQEEIMQHISENVFRGTTDREGRSSMRKFIFAYADYLGQLRRNVSGGILKEIEREIRENYADNLTLKNLGQKYYINSSYLGQIFRRQYGQSFRDYLSAYRIARAEELLLHTDKKIAVIAEEVGYNDIDYFINRFIALKGVTPARFRRMAEAGD